MKNYGLYTKELSDIIHKVKANTIEEAITFFSKSKKLSKKIVVDIWLVKEITK
jgi:hypothetical protein